MTWWWDHYIEDYDLYPVYHGFSSFIAGERLNQGIYQPDKTIQIDHPKLEVYALRGNKKLLLWIRRNDYSLSGIHSTSLEKPLLIKEGKTKLRLGISSNSFQIEWWDTKTGKIKKKEKFFESGKSAEIMVPIFNPDIAAKVTFE